MVVLRHRLQRSAKLDHIPVTVVPVVEEFEIFPDFVNRHVVFDLRPYPYIGLEAAESEIVPAERASFSDVARIKARAARRLAIRSACRPASACRAGLRQAWPRYSPCRRSNRCDRLNVCR